MIEEKELSKTCFYYEMFMERAYGKYEPIIPGYHSCVMRNLIIAEKGTIISVTVIAYFEKQLTEVKKHMEDALDNFMIKPNVPAPIIDELKRCKGQVIWAISSEDLMKIVYEAIDLTVGIPIEMSNS